ncbi:hypothetical protein [Paenibacillus puerhi]|uniref:hypothetical protein n=1 Tax=Paenibacillus puerhi TaxID=2692622 RepID=UPI00135ABFD4|nr:hypothetical protein [Paenibacillus puerhi]
MLHQVKLGLLVLIVALVFAGCGSGKSKAIESLAQANVEPVASIPEQDIHLYPAEEGVVLKIGELQQQMNWAYSTPRQLMPVLQVNDYNQDGKDELAVVLPIGSGTGVAVEELHLVEFLEADGTAERPWTDHVYPSEEYMKQLRETLGFKKVYKDGELFGQLTIADQLHEVSLKDVEQEYGSGSIHDELGFGSIVKFGIEKETLTFTAAIGFVIDGVAEPQYFGELTAVVSYASGKFKLDQYRFTGYSTNS